MSKRSGTRPRRDKSGPTPRRDAVRRASTERRRTDLAGTTPWPFRAMAQAQQ